MTSIFTSASTSRWALSARIGRLSLVAGVVAISGLGASIAHAAGQPQPTNGPAAGGAVQDPAPVQQEPQFAPSVERPAAGEVAAPPSEIAEPAPIAPEPASPPEVANPEAGVSANHAPASVDAQVANPPAPAHEAVPQDVPTHATSKSEPRDMGVLESQWVRRPGEEAVDAELEANSDEGLGRVRISFAAGYFYGGLDHPLMAKSNAHGGMMEFDFGLLATKHWSVGFALQAAAMPIRDVGGQYVRKGVDYKPVAARAGCDNCPPVEGGGQIIIGEALMTSVIPRVEYTPLGRTGPFVGVGGGVGTINMRGMRVGAAVDARTGFRYSAADRLSFGAILGFHSVFANEARAVIPFAAAEIRMN